MAAFVAIAKPAVHTQFGEIVTGEPPRPRVPASPLGQAPSLTTGLTASIAGFGIGLVAKAGPRLRRRAGDQKLVMVSTPAETFAAIVAKGEANSKASTLKTLWSSTMGGCYVGMSGLLSFCIAGNLFPGVPVAQTVIFAALFPINLLLVLQSGGQLFTGNTANMSMAFYEKKIQFSSVLRNFLTSYMGNILGCVLMACVADYVGLLSAGTAEMAARITLKKCSFTFGQTVVKAIMCNWLVCMAVWLETMEQDLKSKMVGIWFPISMFIMIGFEHSVANMFVLPAGLLSGAPLTVADTLWKNLLPVTIGNLIAGTIVIGAGFCFAFGRLGSGERGSFTGLFFKGAATTPTAS